jgi:hypothetical protein
MKRFLVALAILGIFAVVPLASAGATTGHPETRVGNIYGLLAPSNGQLSNSTPGVGSLHYNGGPIMKTSNSYTIFWAPSGYAFPAGYVDNLNQYFKDLQATQGSNTNTYDNATQYYQVNGDGTKTYVQNKVTFAGTTMDTNPLPQLDPVNCPDLPVAAAGGVNGGQSATAGCVTDAQVQQEISNVVKAKGWPVNGNTEFFMYTAPNIGTCFPAGVGAGGTTVTAPLCSFSYFCAYHSAYFDSTINASSQIIYANMPYDAQTAGNPLTCDVGDYPNSNPSDPEISTTSHEQNESMTDPFGTGWWDSNSNDSASGDENGDMCAYDFGTTTGPANQEWDQTINGHHYLMQLEWDNSTNSCPGSDASGNPTGTPNYDTPQILLTPNIGYGGATFQIVGQFFAVGDSVTSKFADAGVTTRLGTTTATVNASGHFTFLAKVPLKAKAGTATVSSSGSSGTAKASFTVPSK